MTDEEAKKLGKTAEQYTLLQAPAEVIDGHAYFLPSDVKRAYIDGYKDENKNYEKQKEINKELVEENEQLKAQNTKAQEIIKLLLWDVRNKSYEPVQDVEKAEHFLGRDA